MTDLEMSSTRPPDSPISFSRFNVGRIPPKVLETPFGKVRAFSTFTVLEWIYLAVSIIALTVSLGITIQRLTTEKPSESDFTFAILLLLTIVFCYHYSVHSIFTERWDELMVFVISNVIVLVYCILNYMIGEQPTVKLVRLILVCTLGPFLIVVGILLSFRYCKSNNLIYNTVGANSSLQKACRMYYICSSLLKFDLQLQLSMVILVMTRGVTDMSLRQKVILASGVPISFLVFILGVLGLRFENKTVMVLFYILGLLEPIYIVYKFYWTANFEDSESATYDSTFACGYFALVIWVCLIISTVYFILYGFGKGLKEKIYGDKENTQPLQSTATSTVSPSSEVNASEGAGTNVP